MSFDAFKRGGGDDADPPDGEHTAYLERTSVFESKAGAMWLRTCWRTIDLAYYWETLNALEGQRMTQTRQLIETVGVDLDKLQSWDQLGDELAQHENTAFVVKVSHNGNFLNTAVTERPANVQEALTTGPATTSPRGDLPVDTSDFEPRLPAGERPASDLFGDDDIPF